LRGSPQGFNSQRDLVVRKTPTVKLKMNVEITIKEFNGAQFQTNLAILLGIPPERIKVVAAARRLQAYDDLEDVEDDEDSAGVRRLGTASSTGLDVTIEPSTEVAAASGGGSTETSANSLDNQASELNQVSQSLSAMQSSNSLAAAAGGKVVVTEMKKPAVTDTETAEQKASAADTVEPTVVDVSQVAAAASTVQVSAAAGCSTNFMAVVSVGGTPAALQPTTDLASGETDNIDCGLINTGYEGNVTLRCQS